MRDATEHAKTGSYEQAVPVLQVKDVKKSLAWYGDVLGFAGDPFPPTPPHSFAMTRGQAEIMLQCSDTPRGGRDPNGADPEFLWSVYLRVAGTGILDVAASVAKHTPLLRGPERM